MSLLRHCSWRKYHICLLESDLLIVSGGIFEYLMHYGPTVIIVVFFFGIVMGHDVSWYGLFRFLCVSFRF